MTNKLSEEAFNQILLQIAGKKLLDIINMINSDAKFKIEKLLPALIKNINMHYRCRLIVYQILKE